MLIYVNQEQFNDVCRWFLGQFPKRYKRKSSKTIDEFFDGTKLVAEVIHDKEIYGFNELYFVEESVLDEVKKL